MITIYPIRANRPFIGGPVTIYVPPLPFPMALVQWLQGKLPFIPVWHGKLPQRLVLPGIWFLVVDGDSVLNLQGASGGAWLHVRFTAASNNPSDIWYYADTLRKAIISKPGGPWPGYIGNYYVQGITRHPQISDYTPAIDGSDRGHHQYSQEFYIYYAETLS